MSETPLRRAAAERDKLKSWLLDHAYPRWWTAGADHQGGGFWERLGQDGTPEDRPRRARVATRQLYCYAMAPQLGWRGPAAAATAHGLDWFLGHFRRPDGLFRSIVGRDGTPRDEHAPLYDQAFGLFALAAAAPRHPEWRCAALARETLSALRTQRSHPAGGFVEDAPAELPFRSNPHMHLLEACLAWEQQGADAPWSETADALATLALTRYIDPRTGALREFFDAAWAPLPGLDGRLIEPGHQFEWGWLLMRWASARRQPAAMTAALRLVAIGEEHGIDRRRGVAVGALLDDFSLHDPVARLWPQTERIKAACLAARMTGDPAYWDMAARGAQGLAAFLATAVPGLWWDHMHADGRFVAEAAPASSFYHIVCAVLELDRAIGDALSSPPEPGRR